MRQMGTLCELAQREIRDDLDLWPEIKQRVTRQPRAPAVTGRRLVVAAVLAGVLVVPLYGWWNSTAEVSAAEILGKAGAAGAGAPGGQVVSYHLVATRTTRDARGQVATAQLETWRGSNGRWREEVRTSDATQVVGGNGPSAWMHMTLGSETFATTGVNPHSDKGLVLTGYSDVTNFLSEMSERACGRAALTGEATVAGRSVHVVKVTGDKADCVEPKSNAPMRRDEDEGRPFEATFWIDKQTFLPLRSEEQHTPKGSLRYDVSRVEYNVQLPETLFQFAPPAGARIFSRVEDLKMAVANKLEPAQEK